MTIVALLLCGILASARVRANPPTPEPPTPEPPTAESPTAEPPTGELAPDSNEERATTFVRLMAEGNHEDAVKMMDSKMAAVLPADKLREIWDALVAQVGSFQSTGASRLATESGYKVVYVACKF